MNNKSGTMKNNAANLEPTKNHGTHETTLKNHGNNQKTMKSPLKTRGAGCEVSFLTTLKTMEANQKP